MNKKNPSTWTTVWGLTVEVGAGLGGVKGGNWDNYNSTNSKTFLKTPCGKLLIGQCFGVCPFNCK